MCPNKLHRERLKWGKQIVDRHNAKSAPGKFGGILIDKNKNINVDIDGWYYDGKKYATLVRDTKYVNVQVSIYLFIIMALA